MNLKKDNQDIYTIDSKSYSEYMQENWEKPKDFLSSFIKFLLFILLLVMAYFFYKVVKADLSFSEVFNKQELLSTYELFDNDGKQIDIEKENYVEVLAKNISTDVVKFQKTVVLGATQKHDEFIVEKKEKKIVESLSDEMRLSETYLDLIAKEMKTH